MGTTVKTVIGQLDDVPSLSFLKILRYFPLDLCVYELFEVDTTGKIVFSIPLLQVVSGQGQTCFGERKRVQGWFNDQDVRDL